MFYFQFILISFIFINLIKSIKNINSDEIKSLPGLKFKPNFNQYSGYLQVSDNNFLFYWLITSQTNSKNAPLVVWFNSPGSDTSQGCSSLEGLFSEIGPYLINSDSTISKNSFSWNKNASLLFIENPAGVGFSYAKNKNIRTGDNKTADENYIALKIFYKKFPNYLNNELYFAGISYAGYSAPLLARRVLDGQKDFKLNLKGILLGNPILNVWLNNNMALQFSYSHGFVDENLWNKFKTNCCKGCVEPSNCDINFISSDCRYMMAGVFDFLSSGRINPFDIYKDCDAINGCFGIPERTYIENYLAQEEVEEALHISKQINKTWQSCINLGDYLYHIEYDDITPILKGLLNENIKIMIYHGDTDALNFFLTSQKIVENLGFNLTNPKQAWTFKGQIAGFKTEYENKLTFTTVKGVGHMVPKTAPALAEYIFNQFINNQPL